jgi:polyisoprenoid-binding protein YceI
MVMSSSPASTQLVRGSGSPVLARPNGTRGNQTHRHLPPARPVTALRPALVRTVDGAELPAPGRWDIPTSHVALTVRAGGRLFGRVDARLRASSGGSLVIGEDPHDSGIVLPIDVDSIDSGHADRDREIRDRLVECFGEPITFSGRPARPLGPAKWTLAGALTGPRTTVPLTATVRYHGVFRRPAGSGALWLTATTTIDPYRVGFATGRRFVRFAARRPVSIGIDLLAIGPQREPGGVVTGRAVHGRVAFPAIAW